MKFLVYNQTDGSFIGWYDDQIHTTIPTPNIQVTEDEYHSLYHSMDCGKTINVVNNQVVLGDRPPVLPTWDDIRNQRNYLLSKSDFTQMPDNELTLEKQQAWKTYRSALRRIPETFQSPEQVVWPTPPA